MGESQDVCCTLWESTVICLDIAWFDCDDRPWASQSIRTVCRGDEMWVWDCALWRCCHGSFRSRRPQKACRAKPVHAFLVPDITPPPGQTAAAARAALQAADLMPLWEIAARTVAEIVILILIGGAVAKLVERLGRRADRVSFSIFVRQVVTASLSVAAASFSPPAYWISTWLSLHTFKHAVHTHCLVR